MESLPTSPLNQKGTYIQLFTKSKHFSALLFGQIFSLLGSSITNVVLPIIVLQISHSTAMMGIVMAINMTPFVILLPFAGVLVDKLNKVKIMFFVDVIRFVLMAILSIFAFLDQLNMPILFIFMFFMGIMDSLFQPAYSGVKAKIFTEEIRNAANSLTQVSMQFLRIFGPIIGGVIVSVFSPAWGFGINAVTYILSFCFLLSLRSLSFQRSEAMVEQKSSIKEDLLEGIIVLKQQAWLWITILAFSLINLFNGGIIRVIVPWLINIHYHFEPIVYGLVLGASGAGAIVCGIIFGSKPVWKKRGLLAYSGVALSGVALLFMSFTSSIPLLITCMFLVGAGTMLFGLIWETSLQELVPEEKFGRVASLDMLGSFALLPVGYLVTGWLAGGIGEIFTMIVFSIVIVLISILSMLHKGIRKFD